MSQPREPYKDSSTKGPQVADVMNPAQPLPLPCLLRLKTSPGSPPDMSTLNLVSSLHSLTLISCSIYPGIDPKPFYDAQAYKGKVVFIAGASRGIGAEIALTYARAGASLVLSARNHATLESLKVTISKEAPKAPVLTVSADVTNVKQVKAAVEAAIAKYGKIDTVIANAGRADAWDKRVSAHPFLASLVWF